MGRSHVVFIALLLLVSDSVFTDVDAAERLLLSSVMASETPSFQKPPEDIQQQPGQYLVIQEQAKLASRQHFDSLADALLMYESIQNSGRWQAFTAGPLLRQGDRHPQVSQLKAHLQLLGDLPSQDVFSLASQRFDRALHEALVRFQTRHAVKADGVFGPKTRALLNVPPWQRIDQLVLNMYRQQQSEINDEVYLHINLPEYRLRFYQFGEALLDMRAVVGKRTRQTPEFSAAVTRLVINPDWNVPKSIAYRDILPKLQDDPEFLTKRNLKVVSGWQLPRVEVPYDEVDFSRMYKGAEYFRFWEPPSERNTLGRMKFQLNSDNSIYLHDTQQKYLFEAEKRAFSSGCIRLEEPRALADTLMQVANQWAPDVLDPLFADDETIKLRVEKSIAVHVTYWTAWLDKSGVLNFADDMYYRDSVDFAAMQETQLKDQQKVEVAANWSKTVQSSKP